MSATSLATRAAVRLDAAGNMEVDGVAFLGNIGRGSYGEVVVGRDSKNDGQLVAIKCMSRTQLAKAAAGTGFRKRAPRAAVAESLALSVLGSACKQIPTLFRTIEDPRVDDIFFVMELADAGACMTLHPSGGAFTSRCGTRIIESECAPAADAGGRDPPSPVKLRVFDEADVAHIAADVLAALNAAHSCGFAHRDVSPANILLRSDGTAMLADFGVCASARVDITKAAEEAAADADIDCDEAEDEGAEAAGDASPLPIAASGAAPGGASSGTRKDRFGPFPPKPGTKPPLPETPAGAAWRRGRASSATAAAVHAAAAAAGAGPAAGEGSAAAGASAGEAAEASGAAEAASAYEPVWVTDMAGPFAFQPPEACGAAPSAACADGDHSAADAAAATAAASGAGASGEAAAADDDDDDKRLVGGATQSARPEGAHDAKAADMWMLGCALHCLLTGRQPFASPLDGPVATFDAIAALAAEGAAPYAAPEGVGADTAAFLAALLQPDPRRRPTPAAAAAMPFVAAGASTPRRAVEPVDVASLPPVASATLAYLKSQRALGGDSGRGGSMRVRRDSTPMPPPDLPPEGEEDDEDGPPHAVDADEPLWEGWLQKRGRIRKSWQPRYFFIKFRRVYYFKAAPPPGRPLDGFTPQELERAATGSMSLVDVQDVGRCPKPGKPLRFSVTAGGRTLFLMPVDHGADAGAQGEVVMQRWMLAFDSLREDDDSSDDGEGVEVA
ncbi:hypothetical protein FNF27_01438 [Cafeteria roenbergensis]|uniref:non-specific serine/threonine protein kinase n=2 Tax=Cafeteria roenbergensis TaxID=33653 RepID=A0A5A8EIS3_CAFRO|nr:hypothetical protein FNF27_01438 [Cafeteria roenbergensis]